MSDSTELQILLVGNDPSQYSEAAMLLRNAGYVLLKCGGDQVASMMSSFRVDAVVVATDTRQTFSLLRSLPITIDPNIMLVVSNAPDAVHRLQPGVLCIPTGDLEDQLTQAMDGLIAHSFSYAAAHNNYQAPPVAQQIHAATF